MSQSVKTAGKNDSRLYWESGWSCWLTFVEEYGTLAPLQQDKPALCRWVEQQRVEYKKFTQGKPSDLDQEMVDKMSAKGFQWEAAPVPSPPAEEEPAKRKSQPGKGEVQKNGKGRRKGGPAVDDEDGEEDEEELDDEEEEEDEGDEEEATLTEMERMSHDAHVEDDSGFDEHTFHALGGFQEDEDDDPAENTESDDEWTDSKPRAKKTEAKPKAMAKPKATAKPKPKATAKPKPKAKLTPTRKAPKRSPPPSEASTITAPESASRYPKRARRSLADASEFLDMEIASPATKRARSSSSRKATPETPKRAFEKTSPKTGERRSYEHRNLRRLIPVEAEDDIREQCRVEFAELLKTDEPMVPDKEKGVEFQTAKSNVNWEKQFLEFLVFKKVYGHGIVPKIFVENLALGRWTILNRKLWKKKDSRLNKSKIRRLKSAGFVFEAKKDPFFWKVQQQTYQEEEKWESKFNMLREYKEEHGDCLVPKEYQGNLVLARWVSEQRKQKKVKTEGGKHNLSDEREQRLLDMGFVFNSRTREQLRLTVLNRFQERWQNCFERLLEFKARFGHCAVPRRWKEDPDLVSWAMRQRSHGKKYIRGEDSFLTKERYELLKSVDFVFFMERDKYSMEGVKTPPKSTKEKSEEAKKGAEVVAGESSPNEAAMLEDDNTLPIDTGSAPDVVSNAAVDTLDEADVAINRRQRPRRSTQASESSQTTKKEIANEEVVGKRPTRLSLKKSTSEEPAPEIPSRKRTHSREVKEKSANTKQPRRSARSLSSDPTEVSPKRPTRNSLKAAGVELPQSDMAADPEPSQKRRARRSKTPEKSPGKEVNDGDDEKVLAEIESEKKPVSPAPRDEKDDLKDEDKEVSEPKSVTDEEKQPETDGEIVNAEKSPKEVEKIVESEEKKIEEEMSKGPSPEELKQRAAGELLKANKGRWICENCGKDEHFSYVNSLAHEAMCISLEAIIVPDDVSLE